MSTIEQDPTAEQADEAPEPDKPKLGRVVELPDGTNVFVRLPNQFQHDDIRDKALAAKARRIRQLRDPEADAFVILDEAMDTLLREGDTDALVEQLVNREWWKDHLEAVKDVDEREEFEHVADDQRRYEELLAQPEDERPADEFATLERHISAYNDAVTAAREERQRPRREALASQDVTDLVQLVREQRITQEANETFNTYFTKYEIYECTYQVDDDGKPRGKPYFESIGTVQKGDPEIIEALTNAYNDLERQFTRGFGGNS